MTAQGMHVAAGDGMAAPRGAITKIGQNAVTVMWCVGSLDLLP